MIEGIDVSENNGHLDQDFWNMAYEQGIRFAYIRCSYGRTGADEEFQHNVACAHNAGLKVGAYHYGYGLNVEQAREEAEHCRQVIDDAGVLLELPVFYDMEDADHYKARHGFAFDPVEMTEICHAFIDTIGLDCGVYASLDWLDNYIDWKVLECPVWNAQWGDSDDIQGYVWQDSDHYDMDGHQLDHDYMYIEE